MSFFKDLSKTIRETSNSLSANVKDYSEKTQINTEIANLENSLNDCYRDLGKKYFESLCALGTVGTDNASAQSGNAHENVCIEEINAIKDILGKIDEYKNRISTIEENSAARKEEARIRKEAEIERKRIEAEQKKAALELERQKAEAEALEKSKKVIPVPSSFCENCGSPIDEDMKFCANCGAKLKVKSKKYCPKCGTPVNEGEKFCMMCGEKIVEDTKPIEEDPVDNMPTTENLPPVEDSVPVENIEPGEDLGPTENPTLGDNTENVEVEQ